MGPCKNSVLEGRHHTEGAYQTLPACMGTGKGHHVMLLWGQKEVSGMVAAASCCEGTDSLSVVVEQLAHGEQLAHAELLPCGNLHLPRSLQQWFNWV